MSTILFLTASTWLILFVARYLPWLRIFRPIIMYLLLVVTGLNISMLILSLTFASPFVAEFADREFPAVSAVVASITHMLPWGKTNSLLHALLQ